jgi:hypothetical protein
MNDSSEDAKAPDKTGFLKIGFFRSLSHQEGDIMALVRRISRVSNISAKQLDQFIAAAKRIHESSSVELKKLEDRPEVYEPELAEPTAKVEKQLRNLEDRLNTLYRKMHDGRSFDFPPFLGTREAQQSEKQSKRNSPFLRGPQDPGSQSTGHAEGKFRSKGIGH